MDSDPVLYVSNDVCPDNGSGIEAAPYCSLATALQQIGMGERGTVILQGTGTPYAEGLPLTTEGPRTVAVVGVGDPSITLSGADAAAAVGAGTKLYVSGVDLSSSQGPGASCTGSGARLWLDDLTVGDSADGVVLELCKARLRRVLVVDNTGDGIAVANSGELVLESSVVANGGASDAPTAGLRVSGAASAVRAVYTTVANNESNAEGRNVYCEGGDVVDIRNSIVVSPGLNSISCAVVDVSYSVHDNSGLPIGHDNNSVDTFGASWWDDIGNSDFHVAAPGMSVFGGRARWELGDPMSDLDGQSRSAYPGQTNFAGADEP